jgi:hypothetical protein
MKTTLHISGSSLLEAVIAIAIIAGCLAVGLSIFVSVTNVQPPTDFYTQDSQLKRAIAYKTDTLGLRKDPEPSLEVAPSYIDLGALESNIKVEVIEILHKADTLDFELHVFKNTKR